jgi:hypothetical protein
MSQEPLEKQVNEDDLFPFTGYLIINLIFWVYCVVQLLVTKWLLRETTGLYFFFAVLAIGFTLVSIYDYSYDRISLRKRETAPKDAERAGSTPTS